MIVHYITQQFGAETNIVVHCEDMTHEGEVLTFKQVEIAADKLLPPGVSKTLPIVAMVHTFVTGDAYDVYVCDASCVKHAF